MINPEPFTRESQQKLKQLETTLKQTLADVRAIKSAKDYRRVMMVVDNLTDSHELAYAVHKQIDPYGIRRESESRRMLPAPKPKPAAKAPIITTPRQMMLLPGPVLHGEEVQ